MKQFIDKNQVKQLLDIGVDMSDTMLSLVIKQNGNIEVMLNHIANKIACMGSELIPTLTIGELIERLPSSIIHRDIDVTYYLSIDKRIVEYNGATRYAFMKNVELIDNLFDCYVQLIKSGII